MFHFQYTNNHVFLYIFYLIALSTIKQKDAASTSARGEKQDFII